MTEPGQTIQDLLAVLFLIAGVFFMFVGALGIYRMPDAFHRIHAASKCSTLGIVGMLLAVLFHVGSFAIITKGAMLLVFASIALPVGSHMLCRAAQLTRCRMWPHTRFDEFGEDHPPQEAQDANLEQDRRQT